MISCVVAPIIDNSFVIENIRRRTANGVGLDLISMARWATL
jgi:hypothetical protein